jgi:osmoprotectant transport system substrate-binding protein
MAELELSLIRSRRRRGRTAGEVTATDGAVAANDLVILQDDKQFFVPCNVAMTVRQQVLDQHPQLAEVFNPIAEVLTTDLMRGLNERVDMGGELPAEVAEQFLQDNGSPDRRARVRITLAQSTPRSGTSTPPSTAPGGR